MSVSVVLVTSCLRAPSLLSVSVLVLESLDKGVSAALLHVGSSMGSEVVGSGELSATALNVAAEGSVVGVDLHVSLEVLVSLESLVAVLAHKLLLAHSELKLGGHRQDAIVGHDSGSVGGVDDRVQVLDLGRLEQAGLGLVNQRQSQLGGLGSKRLLHG